MNPTNKQEPLGGATIYTEAQVTEAWACVRKNNHSIPDDALDNMRAVLLAATRQPQAGAAGASEVKPWQERTDEITPTAVVMAMEQEIADLRAQLARQRQGSGEPVYQSQYSDKHPEVWVDCSKRQYDLYVEHGEGKIPVRVLYTTPAPQAQGEPVAWITFRTKDGRETLKEGCVATNRAYTEAHSQWVWEPLGRLVKPAAQADEGRDAARYRWLCDTFGITKLPVAIERLLDGGYGATYVADGKAGIDAAIDKAMRTTAADNQKG